MGTKRSHKELTEQDIRLITSNTNFNRQEILKWYEQFCDECHDGLLDLNSFVKFYSQLLPNYGNPDEFAKLVFKAFDRDTSGYIELSEFLIAFSISAKGSLRDRLSWAFNFYDQDNNGFIDAKELISALEAIFKMMGIEINEANSPEIKAEKIFKILDLNKDDQISEKEFVEGCINDAFLRHLLGPNI